MTEYEKQGAEIDRIIAMAETQLKLVKNMENAENEAIRCFISNNGKTREKNGYRYNVKAYHDRIEKLHNDDCLTFRVHIEKKVKFNNIHGDIKTTYIWKKSLIMDYYQVKLLKSQLPETFLD